MTKAKISEYDAVASNNTDVNGVNIAEGCPPSGMNNMGREIMAALKRFQVGSDGDGVTVGGSLVVSGSSTVNTFTAGQSVISVDSTDPALRITQVGTGNALRVEDSTNPDATPFVVDADGRALTYGNQIGYVQTSALAPYATSIATNGLINWSGNSSTAQLALGQQVTSSAPPIAAFYKARGGLTATPTIVSSGDATGSLRIHGYDGTNFIESARIEAAVDGTPGTNDMPGRLVFSTTADGAASTTERMRIASDGQVTLSANAGLTISKTNVTSPAATDGNVYSGTYTPTLTNSTNISSSSANIAQYMRVGNVVTVSGQVDIDPTAGTSDTILRMSLPVATNILGQTNAGGTFYVLSGIVSWGGSIYGDSTNEGVIFRMYPGDGANRAYQFTFTYQVI